MGRELRQEALEYLLEKAEKQGYVTFDDIMDCADEKSLPIQDFDWLSSAITTRGLIIYDEAPINRISANQEEDEYDDYAQSDYEAVYNRIIELDDSLEPFITEIRISQLKFLYPLKTLVFPAFLPPRFGPFPSFFPLREEMRETFFRPSLQPYPAALRKFAWPLWWRGRKCSLWYLHQNVPAAPAHPWVRLREREGWSYMYVSTDGSENHPYPRSSFGSIGIRC